MSTLFKQFNIYLQIGSICSYTHRHLKQSLPSKVCIMCWLHFRGSQTSKAKLRFELKLLFSRQSNFHLHYDFSSIQLPLTRTTGSSFYFLNPNLLKKKFMSIFVS